MAEAPTREHVAERLEEAARTLRALPARGCFPARPRALWPEPIQRAEDWLSLPGSPSFLADLEHARQRAAEDRLRIRITPTAAEIARMDEALEWLLVLRPLPRVVASARAQRVSCRKIGRIVGLSKSRVQQIHAAALQAIADALAHDARETRFTGGAGVRSGDDPVSRGVQ